MDQDATSYTGRPWLRPQCVTWGPSSLPPKRAQPPLFGHVYCGQAAGWIKMSLGTKVGVSPGDIVLDADPQKGHSPPNFWPSVVAKWLD